MDFSWALDYVLPIVMATWFTILCGGFAYLYWFVAWEDPRNIFTFWAFSGHIAAVLVFPIGWIGLLLSIGE